MYEMHCALLSAAELGPIPSQLQLLLVQSVYSINGWAVLPQRHGIDGAQISAVCVGEQYQCRQVYVHAPSSKRSHGFHVDFYRLSWAVAQTMRTRGDLFGVKCLR